MSKRIFEEKIKDSGFAGKIYLKQTRGPEKKMMSYIRSRVKGHGT
jgi:hypothetical protein